MRDSLGTRVANICNLASVTVLDRKKCNIGSIPIIIQKLVQSGTHYQEQVELAKQLIKPFMLRRLKSEVGWYMTVCAFACMHAWL